MKDASDHVTVLYIFDLSGQKHRCLTFKHHFTEIKGNEKACLLEKYQCFGLDQMEHHTAGKYAQSLFKRKLKV